MQFPPRTVAELAALVGGRVQGSSSRLVSGLRALDAAGPDDLAAVFRPRGKRTATSRAGCLLVREGDPRAAGLLPTDASSLVWVADPEAALDTLAEALRPADDRPAPGVHPAAIVEPGAEIDGSASVGPWVWIGRGARVGARTVLMPGVHLGAGAAVGCDGVLHPHVVVGARCRLGDRVLVHAGAVIGADGFGFRQDRKGRHHKSPQVGVVIVGDDVEIGANTTIDRARLEATVIGNGVKVDDQVHVGHNCVLGDHVALAGQVGLAGGVRVGARVLVGGRAAVADGRTIGEGALLSGGSMVLEDVPPGARVGGWPAISLSEWKRQVLSLRRLPALLAAMRSRRRPPEDEDVGGA